MRASIQKHPIVFFFVFTFVIAWLIWIPVGLLAPTLFLPATLLGAWSPTFSAVILTGVIDGRDGLQKFIKRLFLWRVGWQWYGVVLFSIAVIWAMAVALHRLLGGAWPPLVLPVGVPAEGLGIALPLLFVINLFIGGPLAEDVGWRGYALPKLGARLGALRASLIIGVVWALWHLPFFVIPQGAAVVGGIPFGWFMLLTTAWSVLFAWVFVNTQESILLPVLYHAAINTTLNIFDLSVNAWQLLEINVGVTWVVVVAVIAVFGPTLQGRHPPSGERAESRVGFKTSG